MFLVKDSISHAATHYSLLTIDQMIGKKYFEDFEIGSVRNTLGRTITETDIVIHAGQTGDFFPHHMDAEWCKTQPFKKRIAHGTLIFSVAVGMTANLINEVAMTYGYDRLRFILPVFIGDTISVKITIHDKKDHKKPGYGLVTELVETFNQEGKLVMVCEHILLANKKQGEQS
jgi:acyl dehydratase